MSDTDEHTEAQLEQWEGWAERWRTDWRPAMKYLVENTDLTDRREAMELMTMMFGYAQLVRTSGMMEAMQLQAEYTQDMKPKLDRWFEMIEDELDHGEDWKD